MYAVLLNSRTIKEKLFSLALQNRDEEATTVFFLEYQPELIKADTIVKQIDNISNEDADKNFVQNQSYLSISLYFIVGIAVVGVIFVLLLVLYLTKIITASIKQIENTVDAVNNGNKLANETAESLSKVVENVTNINNKIKEIANASEEQASAVNQITLGVEQILAVVQTNSATSEESAASSRELSDQANMLKDLVARFKLINDTTSAYNPIINYNNEEENFYSQSYSSDGRKY